MRREYHAGAGAHAVAEIVPRVERAALPRAAEQPRVARDVLRFEESETRAQRDCTRQLGLRRQLRAASAGALDIDLATKIRRAGDEVGEIRVEPCRAECAALVRDIIIDARIPTAGAKTQPDVPCLD